MLHWLLHHGLALHPHLLIPVFGWGLSQRTIRSIRSGHGVPAPRRSIFSGVHATAHAPIGRRSSGGSAPRRSTFAGVRTTAHAGPQQLSSGARLQLLHSIMGAGNAVGKIGGNGGMTSFGRALTSSRGLWGIHDPTTGFLTGDQLWGSPKNTIRIGNLLAAANATTPKEAAAWWNSVNRYFGGSMPKMRIAPKDVPGAAAWAFPAQNALMVTPSTAMSALSAEGPGRGTLQKILLHEWTHDRQTPNLNYRKLKPLIEGGAESYARDVARQVGLRDTNPAYPQYVRYFNALPQNVQARFTPPGIPAFRRRKP